MSVRSAQSITKVFTTRRVDTGAATNADSLPTGTLYVNGVADAATVTVTNITTGRYKAQVTLPTLAIGDIVDLNINATINSVVDNAVIWSDTKDLNIDSIGNLTVAGYASGQAPLQPTTAGRTLDVSTTGEAGLDFDNIKDASGAHTLTNITVPTVTTAVNVTTVNGLAASVITANSIAADAIGASELAADAVTEIAAAVSGGGPSLS